MKLDKMHTNVSCQVYERLMTLRRGDCSEHLRQLIISSFENIWNLVSSNYSILWNLILLII